MNGATVPSNAHTHSLLCHVTLAQSARLLDDDTQLHTQTLLSSHCHTMSCSPRFVDHTMAPMHIFNPHSVVCIRARPQALARTMLASYSSSLPVPPFTPHALAPPPSAALSLRLNLVLVRSPVHNPCGKRPSGDMPSFSITPQDQAPSHSPLGTWQRMFEDDQFGVLYACLGCPGVGLQTRFRT